MIRVATCTIVNQLWGSGCVGQICLSSKRWPCKEKIKSKRPTFLSHSMQCRWLKHLPLPPLCPLGIPTGCFIKLKNCRSLICTIHTTSRKLTSCHCKHITHVVNRDLDGFWTRVALSTGSRIFRAPMPVQLAGGNLGKHFNEFQTCRDAVAGPS